LPARTNEFQKIVYLVKYHFNDSAIVEESAMLSDLVTGKKREVDVCIHGDLAGHKVCISLECVEKSRKADVTWVEQMSAKHQRLPTNKLILYSKSGFTKDAYILANSCGIDTVSIEQVEEGYIAKLMGTPGKLVSFAFQLSPEKVLFVLNEESDMPAVNLKVAPDTAVHNLSGDFKKTAHDLVLDFLKTNVVTEHLLVNADEQHVALVIGHKEFLDIDGEPVFLKQLTPPALRQVTKVGVHSKLIINRSEVELEHGRFDNLEVSWGSINIFGSKSLLVVSPDRDGDGRISVVSMQ
jgi:hypothetical protein